MQGQDRKSRGQFTMKSITTTYSHNGQPTGSFLRTINNFAELSELHIWNYDYEHKTRDK